MGKEKETGIKAQELTDIQAAVVNMFKQGYLRGYIEGKGIKKGTEKEIWKDVKDKAWKEFEKLIQVKGGKNKNKNG